MHPSTMCEPGVDDDDGTCGVCSMEGVKHIKQEASSDRDRDYGSSLFSTSRRVSYNSMVLSGTPTKVPAPWFYFVTLFYSYNTHYYAWNTTTVRQIVVSHRTSNFDCKISGLYGVGRSDVPGEWTTPR